MYLDKQSMLSNDQTLAFAVGNAASTNYIDLGSDVDLGTGVDVPVLAQITDAFLSAGAATLQLKIQTDDNSSFSSATDIYDSGAIGKASLVAGYKFPIKNMPRANEQYVRAYLVVGTADGTAGTIVITLGSTPEQSNKANA